MNRERARELLPIIEAFANGEEIQARRDADSEWRTMHTETKFPDEFEYRIKPKSREFWVGIDRTGIAIGVTPSINSGSIPAYWDNCIKVREVL